MEQAGASGMWELYFNKYLFFCYDVFDAKGYFQYEYWVFAKI